MVGIPAKSAGQRREEEREFQAYGTRADLTDPMQRIADALLDKVQSLSMRVEELERQRRSGGWTYTEPDAAAVEEDGAESKN